MSYNKNTSIDWPGLTHTWNPVIGCTRGCPYYYAWGNNEKRKTMKKKRCRVIVRGKMNSCEVEFEDGQREIISRNAIRRCEK